MRTPTQPAISFFVDPASPSSARHQVLVQLRSAILSGVLPAGQPIPSTRTVASACGLSRGSVVSIYEDLTGEGYLISIPGSGTRVAEGLTIIPAAQNRPQMFSPPAAPVSGLIDLRPGYPATQRMTHGDWRAAWRTAASTENKLGDPEPSGDLGLRIQVADHLHAARGLVCDPSDIVITAGTSDALSLIFAALNPPDRKRPASLAVENPGYPSAWAIARRARMTLTPIPVDHNGIDVHALYREPSLTAALVTPSHQYPLGGRLTIAQRLELLEWAGKTKAYVIEDDYDSEFRYVGSPLPSIAALDEVGRVLHVGSFSKVLSPHLRCGYIAFPTRTATDGQKLWEEISIIREELGMPVPTIVQMALAKYMASGGFRRHIARTRRTYIHKRALVLKYLSDLPDSPLTALDGGIHAILELPTNLNSRQLAILLRNQGVEVGDLAEHYVTQEPILNALVIGYGSPTDTELTRGLTAVRDAVTYFQQEFALR